jgi:hypothetical protein
MRNIFVAALMTASCLFAIGVDNANSAAEMRNLSNDPQYMQNLGEVTAALRMLDGFLDLYARVSSHVPVGKFSTPKHRDAVVSFLETGSRKAVSAIGEATQDTLREIFHLGSECEEEEEWTGSSSSFWGSAHVSVEPLVSVFFEENSIEPFLIDVRAARGARKLRGFVLGLDNANARLFTLETELKDKRRIANAMEEFRDAAALQLDLEKTVEKAEAECEKHRKELDATLSEFTEICEESEEIIRERVPRATRPEAQQKLNDIKELWQKEKQRRDACTVNFNNIRFEEEINQLRRLMPSLLQEHPELNVCATNTLRLSLKILTQIGEAARLIVEVDRLISQENDQGEIGNMLAFELLATLHGVEKQIFVAEQASANARDQLQRLIALRDQLVEAAPEDVMATLTSTSGFAQALALT